MILAAAPARAEGNPFAWPAHGNIADWASYATVATNIAGDSVHSWRQVDRGKAFTCQGLRLALVAGIAEMVKQAVHRTRPDGSDQLSFFSEHTALAFVSTGWALQVSIPLGAATGYGRLAANRHYPTDVLTGAGVGSAVAWGIGRMDACRAN